MSASTDQSKPTTVYDEILKNWLGHRHLTRRVIDAFPEKDLFSFSIGGMRPFAEMVKEFLAIGVLGLKQLVTGEVLNYVEDFRDFKTKQEILGAWDEATEAIRALWKQIPPERFSETFNLFGQYEDTVLHNIQYFIDNEIHHRGQGYVYLRALGIEPPPFWERG